VTVAPEFDMVDSFSLQLSAASVQGGQQQVALVPMHAALILQHACSALNEQLRVGAKNSIKVAYDQHVIFSSMDIMGLPEDVCLDVIKIFSAERYSGTLMQPLQLDFSDAADCCGDGLLVAVLNQLPQVFPAYFEGSDQNGAGQRINYLPRVAGTKAEKGTDAIRVMRGVGRILVNLLFRHVLSPDFLNNQTEMKEHNSAPVAVFDIFLFRFLLHQEEIIFGDCDSAVQALQSFSTSEASRQSVALSQDGNAETKQVVRQECRRILLNDRLAGLLAMRNCFYGLKNEAGEHLRAVLTALGSEMLLQRCLSSTF
jgi:hypothetical protein